MLIAAREVLSFRCFPYCKHRELHSKPHNTLRSEYRARRRSLSPETQSLHASSACRLALTSLLRVASGRVAAYLADDGELDPEPLLARLHQRRAEVLLPRIVGRGARRHMRFQAVQPGAVLKANAMGLWEPTGTRRRCIPAGLLSLMLIPLVAFDLAGTRLGRGGGFYDVFLSKLGQRRPLLIGYAHECQRTEHIPRQPWDVPLDAVVTEGAVHLISARSRRFVP